MNDERLVVSAMFDKSTVSGRGRTIRYLAVEVRTTDRPKPEKTRLPLNIALVVDASTSMAGAPMRAAKRAAAGVVNLLKSSDRLSLISFANDVQVHLQGVKQNARGRDRALDAIDAIEHRLYTNISGGWLKGAEAVAATMEMQPDAHNHVVLLSDGHANHGILDPLIIRNHAQQLRLRSLNTSTVGIGNNYSATLLQELAEFGGGRMHDAEHPAEIIGVLMGELYELANTYVDDIALRLRLPEGCQVENISGFPTTSGTTELIAHLGALPPAACRTCIFRITAPASDSLRYPFSAPALVARADEDDIDDDDVDEDEDANANEEEDEDENEDENSEDDHSGKDDHSGRVLTFHISASGKCAGTGRLTASQRIKADLTYSPSSSQQRDKETSFKVAQVWHASVVKQAAELNRLGKTRRLKQVLDHEIKFFSRYCHELPEARALVLELELLRRNAGQDWHERVRKEMQLTSTKFLTTTTDFRPFDRQTWWERLEDEQRKKKS